MSNSKQPLRGRGLLLLKSCDRYKRSKLHGGMYFGYSSAVKGLKSKSTPGSHHLLFPVDQTGSPFSGFVLIDQLCLLDEAYRIKRHHFKGLGGSHMDSVVTGISKRCVSSSQVIQPAQKSRQSREVSLVVFAGDSGRIIFNLAMKSSLTFRVWHQPILPQVACSFGLRRFYEHRQDSNIKQR